MSVLSSKPSLIEWGGVRFLIMDKPKDSNLHLYLKECKKHNVTDIVRICEPCYDAAEVEKSGIHLHVSSAKITKLPLCSTSMPERKETPLTSDSLLLICFDALSHFNYIGTILRGRSKPSKRCDHEVDQTRHGEI